MPELSPNLRSVLTAEYASAWDQSGWDRQRRTAAEILARFRTQEGVVLADQVGMGKTFVALAVAVSEIMRTPELGQVVVFVPPKVGQKWVDEWHKFADPVLTGDARSIRCTPNPIRSGEGFLKALDDPPERRNHLVIVTHSALTNSLKDSFVKLALVYFAIKGLPGADDLRWRVAKWSDGNSGLFADSRFTTELVQTLLDARPEDWRRVWERAVGTPLDDDPVPEYLRATVAQIDLSELRQVIRELPKNWSSNIDQRLKDARQKLKAAMQKSWRPALAAAAVRLPLLIVDEAHALKNSGAQISRLFTPQEGNADDGALSGVFERILLMTATPFELGDRELISLLKRLGAVRSMDPPPAEPLDDRLERLGRALTTAHLSALSLDRAWSLMHPDDAAVFDTWTPDSEPPDDASSQARTAWREAVRAVRDREAMHSALLPWIIRHERPPRRDVLPGDAIKTGKRTAVVKGIDIPEESMLPFLLAARAQAIALHTDGKKARPLYAYGLASSYEAYLRLGTVGMDSDVSDDAGNAKGLVEHSDDGSGTGWYRTQIDAALASSDQRRNHPKITAITQRAFELWKSGQKCVIFCWYLRTTRAIQTTLQARIEEYTDQQVSVALGVGIDEVDKAIERLTERVLRKDSSGYRRVHGVLESKFLAETGGDQATAARVADIAIRNLRTKEYLVRYTRLSPELDADGMLAGLEGDNPAGVDVVARWTDFAQRISNATEEHRESVFDAVAGGDDGVGSGLETVRRADSTIKNRDRLIKVFNTPSAPDILVASSVMGEGVDLHQECRHVIHHDLDWNPSKLEQRTGRLDRIGALADREGNIQVFEPFLAGTHDEKMYRVVTDRASWFDIVMGRSGGTSETATDDEEQRVPLHSRITAAMAMDFKVK